MKTVKPPLIVITGPTAAGKTDLALFLAKKFRGAIISADSQQIYRLAKLGTNQPAGQWRQANKFWQKLLGRKKIYLVQGIPHFLINTLSPRQQFSAAQFQKQANYLSRQLWSAGLLPIIVGGTGLYISAVVQEYKFPASKPNQKLRHQLAKLSTQRLQQKLKKLDLETWRTIDRHNRRRLIRALEHVISTGSSFKLNSAQQIRPQTLILGIKISKTKLKQNIIQRTNHLLKSGLIQETRLLLKKYPSSPLLQAIGYREIVSYLRGQINLEEAKQQIITHTSQYTRRQLAWFKRIPNIKWVKNHQRAIKLATQFLLSYKD